MAGVGFTIPSTEFATGVSRMTALQLLAASNHRVHVTEWGISFQGTDPTHAPIKVELVRQSDAGAGGDAVTPVKEDESDDETLQVTALEKIDGSGGDPTDVAVLQTEFVHPQYGYTWAAPPLRPLPVKGGRRLAIVVTAPNDVDMVAWFRGKE